MISEYLFYIFLFFLITFPVTLWAYVFSYVAGYSEQKLGFQLGIFCGALGLVPFLFLEKFYELPLFSFFSVFQLFHSVQNFSMYIPIYLFSCLLFVFFFFCFSYLISLFFGTSRLLLQVSLRQVSLYIKIILGIFLLVFSGLFLDIYFSGIEFGSKLQVSVTGLSIIGIFSVSSYYFIAALGEEFSKYFHFSYVSYGPNLSQSSKFLYVVFVALGFSMLENILYCYSVFFSSPENLYGVILFRSLFSTILHVFCSIVFLQAFSESSSFHFKGRNIFLGILAISLHSFFNIASSLGFTVVLLCFFVGGYFYVCKTLLETHET